MLSSGAGAQQVRTRWRPLGRALFLLAAAIVICCLPGCRENPPQALGTLEWDRVHHRTPAGEEIIDILVREGQQVAAGTLLMQIDDRKVREQWREIDAQVSRAEWQLKELEAGPRPEIIAETRARLRAAQVTMDTAHEQYQRQETLITTRATSRQQLDNARNTYQNAREQVNVQTAVLDRLLAGTRREQINQARFALSALRAQRDRMQLMLEEYAIRAARGGRVDSLPFKRGDTPPGQAVVCTLLAGQRPWARVYVPEPFRARMLPQQTYTVLVDGRQRPYAARLRSISSEASFTPYFALAENDRSRLSYVAELELTEEEADQLTAGTPAQLVLERE